MTTWCPPVLAERVGACRKGGEAGKVGGGHVVWGGGSLVGGGGQVVK